MSKAFILIPGARLPADEADAVLARLTPAESAALASFGDGAGRRHTQGLDAGPCRRAPHLSWLWRVLTRRNSHPPEAPWRWLALGGREQAPELWSLTPLTLGGDGAYCKADGKTYFHDIFDVPVVDTTAAGDTFLGFFFATLDSRGVEKALKCASAASAVAVSRKGASSSIPTVEETEKFLENYN